MILATYLVSWLPSWTTLAASGLLLLAGIGGLVYQRLPLMPYRTLVLIGAGLALYASAWTAGAGNMRAEQERQGLMAANRDLARTVAAEQAKAATLAADASRALADLQAAEARARAAEEAALLIPDTGGVSQSTSDAIRNLWSR